MTPPSRRPTKLSSRLAVAAALVAVLAGAVASPTAFAITAIGLVVLLVGLARGADAAVDVGCFGLFLGVVAGGIARGSVELTLVATLGTIVAWDLGHSAVDLGDQLGRDAHTNRLEAVHAGSSVLVGLVTVTVGYALYAMAAGGQPASAVLLLLLAATLAAIALGVRTRVSKPRGRGRSRSRTR